SNPNIASTAKKAAINKFLDTYQNKSDLSQESISKINDIIAKQTQLDNIIKEQNQTLGKPDLQMQNPPSDDFKSLTEMWKAVLNFKTEKEAIDYIKREAPLGLKNHETANNKLKGLSEWHYRWENKGEFKNGLQALFMIKEMMSYSDNINSQNDILNIMAERMKREKLNEIQIQYPWEAIPLISYSEQSISDIQKNNTNYLNFRKLWEADRNNVDKINQIDAYRNSLKMEYLSKHQEIQAHFMFGDFYEKNNSFLISLVHYYHAWKLMKEKDVTQILSLTPSPVDINKLKEKVCELWNKINEAQQSEFKEKFKSEIADDIMKLCTGEDVVPIELQNFLDLFYEYLKSLKNQTSIPQKTFDTILSKELDLAEFINLTQNKKVLPFGFNYDICRFFYYTYNWSQPGNKTKAQAIIDKIENEDTKNTLQRIFNELTY
ncbi:MAG: hypothetical protein MUF15_10040, partial [Acidobacteria bacterium]|nr:hypothetical protein [Acidobacteriota bacterium]